MKKILVLGGGGFIGGHLAKKLKEEGNWVRVVDIKKHEYLTPEEMCDEFLTYDLRDPRNVEAVIKLEQFGDKFRKDKILPFSYIIEL